MSGYELKHMSNIGFRMMSFIFAIRDIIFPVSKRLDQFAIHQGSVIVDFGCGPGSYIEYASQLVGKDGKVYAVDVHPLAIQAVHERAKRKDLNNVVPVLATGYPVDIANNAVDVIYALDMFHHIEDAQGFLKELHRLLKPSGTLFIESGHQRIDRARQKIEKSGYWLITNERDKLFRCSPQNLENS